MSALTPRHLSLLLLVTTWCGLVTIHASAQTGSGKNLYEEGVAAYGNKDYDTACAKFEQSYRAESAPSALFMFAKCERARGHLVAARRHFLRVAETEIDDQAMVKHARGEAATLATSIPKVTLRLASSAPTATVVLFDGVPAATGTPVEIDPGSHEIVVNAPGHKSQNRSVVLVEGQTLDIEVSPGPPSVNSLGLESEASSPVRVAGIVVTTIGATLGATAAVTSIWIAVGCDGESDEHAFGCSRDGDSYASPYAALLPINAVGWVGGVVGLGVGIPLLIAAPTQSANVHIGPSGLAVSGRF